MAASFGLTIGDPTTTLSCPTPSAGGKRTVSGSTPQPVQPAKATPLPSVPDAPPPQTIPLDVVTLTAAVQTAMQPFMARLVAIERLSLATNTKAVKEPIPQHISTPMVEQPCPSVRQDVPKDDWTPVTNRRRRGKTGTNQANPTLTQVNLTPSSYVVAAAAIPAPNQTAMQGQQPKLAIPTPIAFTEVMVIRSGGSFNLVTEQASPIHQPDAIV